MASRDVSAVEVGQAYLELHQRVHRIVDQAMTAAGLSLARAKVLMRLSDRGPMNQATLAGLLGFAPRSVTDIVDVLERDGLVSRAEDQHDRRARVVSLTPAGSDALEMAQIVRRKAMEEIFGSLTATERARLAALLSTIRANLLAWRQSSVTTEGLAEAKAAETRPRSDHRWLVLVVVSIAQLMVVLDATVVNIALPSAQADLGFDNSARQWVVTAYALAFGSLLLLGGRVGDIVGRKRTFLIALVAFALASALGGAAPSFGVLVIARALQGAAGAMLAPAALGTLVTTFRDPRDRGKAFGVFGTVAVTGGAVGLILGGLLTEYLSWRWCMYVNVLFAAAALLGAVIYMTEMKPPTRPRLDVDRHRCWPLSACSASSSASPRPRADGWSSCGDHHRAGRRRGAARSVRPRRATRGASAAATAGGG